MTPVRNPGYALRDDPWERSKDLLPGRPGHVGVTAKDDRPFAAAVLDRYRAGVSWRDLPDRSGAGKRASTRFSRRAGKGVWERVFQHRADAADHEDAMIDSTIVRADPHSAGAPKKTAPTRRSGAVAAA